MLEAAYRSCLGMARVEDAAGEGYGADRRADAARINGSGGDASRCHDPMHHVRATVQ